MSIIDEMKFHLRDLRHNPKVLFGMPKRAVGMVLGADKQVKEIRDNCEILDGEKSLEALLSQPVKSFVRFGDGEMQIMMGSSVFFGDWKQVHDPELQKRMKELWGRDDLWIGIPERQILTTDEELKKSGEFKIWSNMRRELGRFLKKGRKYLDAFVLRENEKLDVKRLWEFLGKRKVVLVTGDESAFEVMKGALPMVYFLRAPAKNAWGKFEEILENVKKTIEEKGLKPEETIFLVSLGPTAKPLVLEITDLGFVAWDTGHFFRKFGEKIKELKQRNE